MSKDTYLLFVSITLHVCRNPVRVIHYSSCELFLTLVEWATSLVQYTRTLAVCLVMLVCLLALHHTPSQYQVSIIVRNK